MISVVIPTLNAQDVLGGALGALVGGAIGGLVKEVVVVDGGSTDHTRDIADAAGCRVLSSAPGRGTQMRTGAAQANAPWLLFLHADTVPDADWIDEVGAFISAGRNDRAGVFRFALAERGLWPRVFELMVGIRTRFAHLPYGDQGLVISRTLYEAVGGYPDWPLFEDVDIVRRIGARRLHRFRTRAVTSGAKYVRDGWLRRAFHNQRLLWRFMAGADPKRLAEHYD